MTDDEIIDKWMKHPSCKGDKGQIIFAPKQWVGGQKEADETQTYNNELKLAIERVVYHNEKYFTPVANQLILNEHSLNIQKHNRSKTDLSEREIEIMLLICKGKVDKEIAEILNISEATASTHRQNIMKKIGCHKIAEIIAYAIRNGFYTIS